MYCTAPNRFYGFLPREQGLVLGAFDIPLPPEVLETATFGILSISMSKGWYSLTRVRYLPSVTPPSQWVQILSIHYVHCTLYSRLELMLKFLDYRRVPYMYRPPST